MLKIIITLLLVFLFASCLEERMNPLEQEVKYNNFYDVLTYLENNGDYINSAENPALIDVDEVYQNISNYLILDIRESTEFSEGHIENAKNIDATEILDYLEQIDSNSFYKIVIVSSSGQKAGYVTSLLRIAGYNNVFSLDFGMGLWNEKFSKVWDDNKNNSSLLIPYYRFGRVKDGEVIPVGNYEIPTINFSDEKSEIQTSIIDRISELIKNYNSDAYIDIEEFDSRFKIQLLPLSYGYYNSYIICYENFERGFSPELPLLYNLSYSYSVPVLNSFGYPYRYDQKTKVFRPFSAQVYNSKYPESDFYSGGMLFTLPLNKEILIYSFNGQRSAYITAYLRLLGYEAKFIWFGAHSMMSKYVFAKSFFINGFINKKEEQWDTLYVDSNILEYSYQHENIRDYPLVVGE